MIGSLWSSDLITAIEEYRMAKAQNDGPLVDLSAAKLRAMGLSPDDARPGAERERGLSAPRADGGDDPR